MRAFRPVPLLLRSGLPINCTALYQNASTSSHRRYRAVTCIKFQAFSTSSGHSFAEAASSMAPKMDVTGDSNEESDNDRDDFDEAGVPKEGSKRKSSAPTKQINKKPKSGTGQLVQPKRWKELKGGSVGEGPIIYW